MNAAEIRAYYRAALVGLRCMEARKPTGRRFGADADALWASFRGDLTTADRLDLLIRDANAQWPGAFGARSTFAMAAVAEDEAFGPAWPGLDPVDAEELWRAVPREDLSADRAALEAAAQAWGFELAPEPPPDVSPTDKLVVAGPSAVARLLPAFVGREDLDWADQITVIATPPGHRQVAALASALRAVTKPARVLRHDAPATSGSRALVSKDATPEDARRAEELGTS